MSNELNTIIERTLPGQSVPQIEPQFSMSDQEAFELGFTVAERMRQRWTGELPFRVELLNNRTYRDQTSQPGALLGLGIIAVERPPYFDNYDAYRKWALPEVTSLSEQTERLLMGDGTEPTAEMVTRARRWQNAYRMEYYLDACEDHELTDAVTVGRELVWPMLRRCDLAVDDRANIVDALAMTLRPGVDRNTVTDDLMDDLKLHGPEVCVALLERETQASVYAVRAMCEALMHPQNPQSSSQISVEAIAPLALRIQRQSAQHLSDADPDFRLMRVVMEALDSSKASMQQAEAAGVDFQQVADVVEGACAIKTDQLSGKTESISHYLTSQIVSLLHKFYLPRHLTPLQIPVGLDKFLAAVYARKYVGFEDRHEIRSMQRDFNQLAFACDSALRMK